MQIVHHFGLSASEADQRQLAAFGIRVHTGTTSFEIVETDASWPAVQLWARARRLVDVSFTRFSASEIGAARWLALTSDWHHGYPQPSDDFGYLQATYDLADYCPSCGVGLGRQRAPFQMTGEPRWGRRGIMQLNWVFDEYFVRPDVWTAVFEPLGVACRPVTNRRGIELQTVVQLVVEDEVALEAAGLPAEACETCGRLKYLPVTRGPLPPLRTDPTAPMAKTREYFGSGASAFHKVLLSQPVARSLRDRGVRGASFTVVAADLSEVVATTAG